MASANGQGLADCLRGIAVLLERGQAVEASALLPEMNRILSSPPVEMSSAEVEEANHWLGRCVALEGCLRQEVVASLQRLAATRKSRAYRRYAVRP